MAERCLRLTIGAIDTLYFGDGQPFNQNDAGAASAGSIYPPLPTTVMGLVRLFVAHRLGWRQGDWAGDPKLRDLLGDRGCVGRLRIRGPFLQRGEQLVLPVPADLVMKRGHELPDDELGKKNPVLPVVRLRPDPAHRLVVAGSGEPGGRLEGLGLTSEGFKHYLEGAVEKLRMRHRLGAAEPEWRTGIARDWRTRHVTTGMLYSVAFRRPEPGDTMVVFVDGAAEAEHVEIDGEAILATGGEGGFVHVKGETVDPSPPAITGIWPHVYRIAPPGYRVVALTPLMIDALEPGLSFPPLPGRLVAAAADRPISIGRWQSRHDGARGTRPTLGRAWPAGTVLFMELDQGAQVQDIEPKPIGENTRWGFGQVALGAI